LWSPIALDSLRKGKALRSAVGAAILYRLKNFEPTALKGTMAHVLNDDTNLDQFVVAIGQTGSDSVGGDFASFEPDVLEAFGGLQYIKDRAQLRLAADGLDNALRNTYKALVSGKKTYLKSGTSARD
jgi:hypothetical protein